MACLVRLLCLLCLLRLLRTYVACVCARWAVVPVALGVRVVRTYVLRMLYAPRLQCCGYVRTYCACCACRACCAWWDWRHVLHVLPGVPVALALSVHPHQLPIPFHVAHVALVAPAVLVAPARSAAARQVGGEGGRRREKSGTFASDPLTGASTAVTVASLAGSLPLARNLLFSRGVSEVACLSSTTYSSGHSLTWRTCRSSLV